MAGLIIVSNRLPVSVKKADGKLEVYPSIGGLATGLSSYATNRSSKWIGWPGIPNEDLTDQDKEDITGQLKRYNCYPVFLSRKQLEQYYNGYSNSVLWPAFHDLEIKAEPNQADWRAYKRVNRLFAEAVLALSNQGSTIWVHDYQLLLVPQYLREQRPTDKIGFFLHIPFPGAKTFATIPHHHELMVGLAGADLLGFHTTSYVQHFLDCCDQEDLGIVGQGELILPDRVVRVTDFPMGIDYGKFREATKQRAVRREYLLLKSKYLGKKVILTVDRLDPTKGLVQRLEAYRELLHQNPILRRKVVMVMLAVPSRTEIAEYQELKDRLEALVKAINAEFGTTLWQPVDYLYTAVPFHVLSAYYQMADVAFIAPIRDGMNLVAKEYVASRPRQNGVLILSETAGAAEELKDAILVNPAEKSSLVRGLSDALNLPQRELRQRVSNMQQRLSTFTVHDWAGTFVGTLRSSAGNDQKTLACTPARQNEIADRFRRAQKRLILLDYDGVLVPFTNDPYKATPTKRLKRLLTKLAGQANTDVAVVSGRSKADLSEWLGDVPIGLAAEHGAFYRKAGGKRWQSTVPPTDTSWQDTVVPILEVYTEKTPGAAIEIKNASVVWHYRRASPYYAQKHLVILKRLLRAYARRFDLVVHQGNMILEIRSPGATKGTIAKRLMQDEPGFVLAIGDDYTDEDMFKALPDWAHTIKIGRGQTAARLRLPKPADVIAFLEKLARK